MIILCKVYLDNDKLTMFEIILVKKRIKLNIWNNLI